MKKKIAICLILMFFSCSEKSQEIAEMNPKLVRDIIVEKKFIEKTIGNWRLKSGSYQMDSFDDSDTSYFGNNFEFVFNRNNIEITFNNDSTLSYKGFKIGYWQYYNNMLKLRKSDFYFEDFPLNINGCYNVNISGYSMILTENMHSQVAKDLEFKFYLSRFDSLVK